MSPSRGTVLAFPICAVAASFRDLQTPDKSAIRSETIDAAVRLTNLKDEAS
jgi:hypothetical protein